MENNNITLFVDENFTKEEIEDFLSDIALVFVEKYFLNNTLSNFQYEKDVFKILNNLIKKELLEIFKNEEELYEGLSLHFFKKYFKLLFSLISELLLKELAYSNHNIVEFLKYYSLNTIVIDTIKYKVPQIKEKDGPRWNVTSMLGILKVYIKAKDYVDKIQIQTHQTNKKLQTYYIDGLSPIQHNENIAKESKILEQKIISNASQINILRDSLNLEVNEEKILKIKIQLQNAKDTRLELREIKANFVKLKIKQIKLMQYNELIKTMESYQRNTKDKYIILKKNQDSYNSLKNSLVIALISKKQVI